MCFVGLGPDRPKLAAAVSVGVGTLLGFGDERNGYGKTEVGTSIWIGQHNNRPRGGSDIQIGCEWLISQLCVLVAANHACRRKA